MGWTPILAGRAERPPTLVNSLYSHHLRLWSNIEVILLSVISPRVPHPRTSSLHHPGPGGHCPCRQLPAQPVVRPHPERVRSTHIGPVRPQTGTSICQGPGQGPFQANGDPTEPSWSRGWPDQQQNYFSGTWRLLVIINTVNFLPLSEAAQQSCHNTRVCGQLSTIVVAPPLWRQTFYTSNMSYGQYGNSRHADIIQ